jgi:serine/threonine protein kinase
MINIKMQTNYGKFEKRNYIPANLDIIYTSLLNQHYKLLMPIGTGAFSIVWKTLHLESGDIYAAKISKNKKRYIQYSREEAQFLSQFTESQYITNMIDEFEIKITSDIIVDHHAIVMEYLGSDLYKIIQSYNKTHSLIPMTVIKKIMCDWFRALIQLKSKDVIHLDTKPENILLSRPITDPVFFRTTYSKKLKKLMKSHYNRQIMRQHNECMREMLLLADDLHFKLADFGVASYTNDLSTSSNIGTRHYLAPEILLELPYDCSVDMWAAACILCELLSGEEAFIVPKDNKFERHVHHLALMTAICGQVPREIIALSPKKEWFNNQNQLIYNIDIPLQNIMDYFQERNLSKNDYENLAELFGKIFVYNSAERITPEEAMQSKLFL